MRQLNDKIFLFTQYHWYQADDWLAAETEGRRSRFIAFCYINRESCQIIDMDLLDTQYQWWLHKKHHIAACWYLSCHVIPIIDAFLPCMCRP